ncbi:glutathione S-transferase 1-like [Clavelina lepadiformis]|uniref:Glutathione S-transferase n=1 Tax=Clavelina lepadiformis TaxID=159417 RepID=A0ABP0FDZ6_CLALP
MGVKLYHFGLSPFSRAVQMTLTALGVKYSIETIDLMKGEQRTDEYKKINPRGKVPALVDGKLSLGESRAIACYLCNKYASGSKKTLYPSAPELRAKVDMLLYVGEWIADTIVEYLNIAGVLFRGEKPKDEKLADVKSCLQYLEDCLKGQNYIAGDNLTIADFFAVCPLLLLENVDFNDYDPYPKLKKWINTMKSLKYFDEINKEPMKMFKAAFNEKLNLPAAKQTGF